MTKKNRNLIITLVVLFILAIVVTVFYKDNDEDKEMAYMLVASFTCADNSKFVAEFPNDDELEVHVDGVLVRKVPMVPNAGQTYEDANYKYVFAGEEATVLNKANGRSTTCSQPVDGNNAPVNFGDSGEGAGINQDATIAVSANLLGRWKSNDDPKFVREFKENGVTTDIYEDKEVSVGTWTLFTKEKPLVTPVEFPLDTGAVYIEMIDAGAQTEKYHFKVTKVTPEELELIYMSRGGTLTFTRMQ